MKGFENKMEEYHFSNINSTQDYAKKLYLEGKNNFLVYADNQTAGRGRNGRLWKSPSGGLWFSFDMDLGDVKGLFTMAIGVATREVLEEIYKCKVQLKWPNDLILDRKKVAGILCEKFNYTVIVGIGINTNVEYVDEEKATTFFNKTKINVNNYEVMKKIIERCNEVINSRMDKVIDIFRENMAYKGEVCFVSALGKDVKVLDVSDNGCLIVEADNETKEVSAGEINVCI